MARSDSFTKKWAAVPSQFERPSDALIDRGWAGGAAEDPPEAKWENWWHNRVDEALAEIEKNGAMQWFSDVPYAVGASVRSGGQNYIAALASTGIQPGGASDVGYWQPLSQLAATQVEAEEGLENTKRMTPLRVAQAIAARTLASTDGLAGAASALKAAASGANATVSVSADAICVKDGAGRQKVIGPVALSINSAAVGANGLDAGVLAASTWYSVWVIWNGADAAGLLSLSATAPTLPAGYTHKARVGWIRTDATANKWPLAFRQVGKSVAYVVAPGTNVPGLRTMASGPQGDVSVPTYVPVAVGAFVPPTAVKIMLTITGLFSASSAIAAPNPNHYKVAPEASSAAPLSISQANVSATHLAATGEFILESGNVYFASSGNPTALLCNGWEDEL